MEEIKLKDFRMTDSRYQTGVVINEYNGQYSIAMAKSSERGIRMDWSFPQKYQDGRFVPGPKAIPHKISLGNLEDAIKTTEWILRKLKGEDEQGPAHTTPDPASLRAQKKSEGLGPPFEPDDDIPF